MIAISNAGLANLGLPPVNMVGYSPKYTYTSDFTAKTLTVTNDTTYASGDSFKNCNVTVNDADGGTVYGQITANDGNTGAMDISGLNLLLPLIVRVTELTTLGCIAVGTSPEVSSAATSGTVGNYIKSFTTAAGV